MGCPSEVEIGDNLTFSANTHSASTGAATDADSVPSYYVYEDETGTSILSGSMAKLDDTNTTGFYTETIVCTSGNGFESGKTYTIYIEAAVSSVTGSISFGFKAYDQRKANVILIEGSDATDQINAACDTAISDAALATAANLAVVDTVVDAIKLKTDNLPTDPADQSSVEAAITSAHSTTDGKIDGLNDFDPSNDTVAHVTLVDTTTTNSDMITDTGTDVAAIKAVTDNLPDLGALTSIAQASTLADVLTDTGTTIPEQISGLNNLSSADVNAACDTAISDAALATASALSTVDTVVDAIKAVTDLLPDAGALSSIATSSEVSALNDISVADIISGIADGSYDLQEMIRIIFAFAAGKSNGGGTTTINFRDGADSKNRITATVDSNGNRTAVTVNGA